MMKNCFFTVGNITLKENIGVPMEIDPALF